MSTPIAQTVALTQPISDKQLARLDVQDVAVTMPDGTLKSVRGNVKVGTLTFTTNMGIDLFPGPYTINVTYAHPADGAALTQTFEANIQP